MACRTIMVQGTASSVGKSILVTALCRILYQGGYKVAPFKSQNMSLNSFVTKEGGEIGRAQAAQAEAAGIEPSIYMNPVLLKPEADAMSQVIVLGKVAKQMSASEYYKYTPHLMEAIRSSLEYLKTNFDIIVIEGAGSPAEINLNDYEIVNMKIARMLQAPVLLVSDIDRGGVFASLIGTLDLLNEEERRLVKGLIINKFRGDISLLKSGLEMLEAKSSKSVLGVIPYFRDLRIAREDSVFPAATGEPRTSANLDIAVIQLPHMSNFDDFDPFSEAGCSVRYVAGSDEIGEPDLIIIPGSKSTIYDLNYLRQNDLDLAVIARSRKGIPVIGICGGYQMLGNMIYDPDGIESRVKSIPGLGLLDIDTTFLKIKTTIQVKGKIVTNRGIFEGMDGIGIEGYEIHMGQTTGQTCDPAFQIDYTPQGGTKYFDGAIDARGLIFGTYLHGLFRSPEFTGHLIEALKKRRGIPISNTSSHAKTDPYNELADMVRVNLNMKKIYEIIGISEYR